MHTVIAMNGFPYMSGLGLARGPSLKLDTVLLSALFSFLVVRLLLRGWMLKGRGSRGFLKPMAGPLSYGLALPLYFLVGAALAAAKLLGLPARLLRLLLEDRVRLVIELRGRQLLLMAVVGLVWMKGLLPH